MLGIYHERFTIKKLISYRIRHQPHRPDCTGEGPLNSILPLWVKGPAATDWFGHRVSTPRGALPLYSLQSGLCSWAGVYLINSVIRKVHMPANIFHFGNQFWILQGLCVDRGWIIVLKYNIYSQFCMVHENLRSKCKRHSPPERKPCYLFRLQEVVYVLHGCSWAGLIKISAAALFVLTLRIRVILYVTARVRTVYNITSEIIKLKLSCAECSRFDPN